MPRSRWLAVLRAAATEVFSMMVGAVSTTPETTDSPGTANVTGVIGIAGALQAIFSLRCSDTCARKIAARMLGLSEEEAAAHRTDAIGEISNMVAGHFKHKIGYGHNCTLTIPTVIAGGSYSVHSLATGERFEFAVTYDGESVWVALDVHR